MNLIGNTFFKVLNKQVLLLKVNVITIILSAIICFFAAYILNSMYLVIIGMVIAIMFRNVLADLLLSGYLSINVLPTEILDIILALLFILIANFLSWWQAMLVMTVLYLARFILMKNHLLGED